MGVEGMAGWSKIRAYVLVKVVTGLEREALSTLQSIPQLQEIDFIFGEYDYVLTIDAEHIEALSDIVEEHIRKAPGVAKTTTLIEAKL